MEEAIASGTIENGNGIPIQWSRFPGADGQMGTIVYAVRVDDDLLLIGHNSLPDIMSDPLWRDRLQGWAQDAIDAYRRGERSMVAIRLDEP